MNGDFFLAAPDQQTVIDFNDLTSRLYMHYDPQDGWFRHGPIRDWPSWRFDRAGLDQGLLYWYFFCLNNADAASLETKEHWAARVAW